MTITDPAGNLATLIRCPSVTPLEAGALKALEGMLAPLGFRVDRMTFEDDDTPPVDNLYARLGTDGPHLMFAGHTDVVPEGDTGAWTHPPFSAAVDGGNMYGRGAVDMKGAIACFVAAIARYLETHGRPSGSISLMITGDEEGPGVNGTEKLLRWTAAKGERWDGCIVGEPTNQERLGDMIKIGRRGSQNGRLTVHGVGGHVAYPHHADNPVRALLPMLQSLMEPPFDNGSEHFLPTHLEVTSIDIGNPATNVIAATAEAAFNIRFNDRWSPETLKAEIARRLEAAAGDDRFRSGREPARFSLDWAARTSPVFRTHDERLIDMLSEAIEACTGGRPVLSTTGGTSDARFIKDYCPVVEFGLLSTTMHMTDEHVPLTDLAGLTDIYEDALTRWFAA